MSSCKNSRFQTDADAFSSLRAEYSSLYAMREEMMVFGRDSLYREYMSKLGHVHLRLFMLSEEVMELKLLYKELQNLMAGGEEVDLEKLKSDVKFRLTAIRKLIDKNSADLIFSWETENVDKKQLYVLTKLLKQITFVAHPLFYQGSAETGEPRRIIGEARQAYAGLNKEYLSYLLERAVCYESQKVINPDRFMLENIKEEIANLHSAIETLRMRFPMNYRYKLRDINWIENEKWNLEREYDSLMKEKNSYLKLLSDFE